MVGQSSKVVHVIIFKIVFPKNDLSATKSLEFHKLNF